MTPIDPANVAPWVFFDESGQPLVAADLVTVKQAGQELAAALALHAGDEPKTKKLLDSLAVEHQEAGAGVIVAALMYLAETLNGLAPVAELVGFPLQENLEDIAAGRPLRSEAQGWQPNPGLLEAQARNRATPSRRDRRKRR